MKKAVLTQFLFISSIFVFPASLSSDERHLLISVDASAVSEITKHFKEGHVVEFVAKRNDIALISIAPTAIERLSALMHEKFNRCGGFMVEEGNDLNSLFSNLSQPVLMTEDSELYAVKDLDLVRKSIPKVDESQIKSIITNLSGFKNRYYRSSHGLASQTWLHNTWTTMAQGRDDIKVEFFTHDQFPQKSVILTINGSQKPDEIVVIGGHGDSILGWSSSNDALAPGADDNASGIATITELLRVIVQEQFVPDRTIKLMSYAAEEVGLRGSADIARSFKAQNKNVVGVMQLDMTNYEGSPFDIVFMNDYTSREQDQYLKSLVQLYLPELRVSEDACGYACSDHASWTRHGYRASIPFESMMDEHNNKIHTENDTLHQSQNQAKHAVNFAKLAIAYAMELSSID